MLVHLPACYDASTTTRYPVVVLLHGSDADETQWIDIGAGTRADSLARSHAIGQVILVMPDEGERNSSEQVTDVVDGLVAWVDRRFRTEGDGTHRAIGGISRGGTAALKAAAERPGLFGAVEGNSPAVAGDDNRALVSGLRPMSGRIRLDVGAADPLRTSVEALAESLRTDGTAVQLEVRAGSHDRAYWRANVARYLTFAASRWR